MYVVDQRNSRVQQFALLTSAQPDPNTNMTNTTAAVVSTATPDHQMENKNTTQVSLPVDNGSNSNINSNITNSDQILNNTNIPLLTGDDNDISAISQAATYANNTSNNTLNNITTPAVNTSIPSSLSSSTTTTTNIPNATTTTNTTADTIPVREVTADYTEPIVHGNDSSSNISNGGGNTTINDVNEKITSDTHLTFNQLQQQPSTDAGAVADLGNDSNSLNQTNTVSPQQ